MNTIRNYFEPNRLLLIWQSMEGQGEARSRRVVAEIVKKQDNKVVFRYLTGTKDYKSALIDNFQGFTAFKLGEEEHSHEVIETFIKRIPPRKREDFCKYLAMHRLAEDFSGSDMALLAYTGAKLPGDGFELMPDFSSVALPIEFMLEVAGFRYQNTAITDISIGDEVLFQKETNNDFDGNAIAIISNGKKIGYVPRPILSEFHKWIDSGSVVATIERINGKPERPLIFLFVRLNNTDSKPIEL